VDKLGAEWTGEGLQSRPMSPAPITQAEKNEVFFLRARLLNAQWSPGFGHENGIIPRALPPSPELATFTNCKFLLESITYVTYLNCGSRRDLNP
jgi:hypothetical protein